MLPFTLNLSKKIIEDLIDQQTNALANDDRQGYNRFTALLMIASGSTLQSIQFSLAVSTESLRCWVKKLISTGVNSLVTKYKSGRKPKLTKTQKKQLSKMIIDGPEANGFTSSCWTSPMIRVLIRLKFNVTYNVNYVCELLRNLGFSHQKAAFVGAKRDELAREHWLSETWKKALKIATKRNGHIMFGDEASFPQWGSLSYTWALKGQQPLVETGGSRRSYKVFGLIEYKTGQFFSKGHEGRLNSESYIDFLKEVLSKTRKHIVLIQDGASYHKSKAVRQFFEERKSRLTVFTLPSYSPDFNPIEMLWKKIKKTGTHMKYFPTFDSLTAQVDLMLDQFQDSANEVLSLFGLYKKI